MVNDFDYSLYFHVPFCKRKCDYCHFYVIPDRSEYKGLYIDALRKEWKVRCPLLANGKPISIYFGGGTPSLLNPSSIEEILSWISPASSVEITLEINPDPHCDLKAFKAVGINRISVGVQSFDDALLKHLSRQHAADDAQQTVETLLQAGFTNISIDLMYDIPHQTLTSWEKTLALAAALPITHLSLYNLTFEPHTVFYKKRKALIPYLADEQMSLMMLEMAISFLKNCGFRRYEISAFAKQNFTSKHNIGYWQNRPFLGFGPSAFSYWKGTRFRNRSHLHLWAKALKSGEESIDFSETLPPLEALQEQLAIGLRMLEGFPKQPFPPSLELKIKKLIKQGLLEETPERLRLTSRGLLFHDTAAETLVN